MLWELRALATGSGRSVFQLREAFPIPYKWLLADASSGQGLYRIQRPIGQIGVNPIVNPETSPSVQNNAFVSQDGKVP